MYRPVFTTLAAATSMTSALMLAAQTAPAPAGGAPTAGGPAAAKPAASQPVRPPASPNNVDAINPTPATKAGQNSSLRSRANQNPTGAGGAGNQLSNPGLTDGRVGAISMGNADALIINWLTVALENRLHLSQIAQQQAQSDLVRQLAAQSMELDNQFVQLLNQAGTNQIGANQTGIGPTENAGAGGIRPAAATGGDQNQRQQDNAQVGNAGLQKAAAATPGALPAARTAASTPRVQRTAVSGNANAVTDGGGSASADNPNATTTGNTAPGTVGNTAAAGANSTATGVPTAADLLAELGNLGVNPDLAYLGIQLAQDVEMLSTLSTLAQAATPSLQQALLQGLQARQQQVQHSVVALRQLAGSQGAAVRQVTPENAQ